MSPDPFSWRLGQQDPALTNEKEYYKIDQSLGDAISMQLRLVSGSQGQIKGGMYSTVQPRMKHHHQGDTYRIAVMLLVALGVAGRTKEPKVQRIWGYLDRLYCTMHSPPEKLTSTTFGDASTKGMVKRSWGAL